MLHPQNGNRKLVLNLDETEILKLKTEAGVAVDWFKFKAIKSHTNNIIIGERVGRQCDAVRAVITIFAFRHVKTTDSS